MRKTIRRLQQFFLKNICWVFLCIPCVLWFIIFTPAICHALDPKEILVIANRNVSESVGLANYYMKKRKVPNVNLLKLSTTDKEAISREEYNDLVADKVMKYLDKIDSDHHIRCIVTVYGIPLKINPPGMSLAEKAELKIIRQRQSELIDHLKNNDNEPEEKRKRVKKELADLETQHQMLKKEDERAAVDSELALVKATGYELSGWLPNPYFVGFRKQKLAIPKEKVLMVSRLDGPSADIVKRIIDDSLVAEKTGLSGTAYFDARWHKPSEAKKVSDYTLYDKSIHKAAKQVGKNSRLNVVVDEQSKLFQPGQCPQAALYCGWYSLAKYVDAFNWQRGAVGYHIASAECTTLKRTGSQVWCMRMLEEGIAATVGPTSEPYVQAFPFPEIFFGFLVDGRLTLVECYMTAMPYVSWQMVLIGDPLYRPFRVSDDEK